VRNHAKSQALKGCDKNILSHPFRAEPFRNSRPSAMPWASAPGECLGQPSVTFDMREDSGWWEAQVTAR